MVNAALPLAIRTLRVVLYGRLPDSNWLVRMMKRGAGMQSYIQPVVWTWRASEQLVVKWIRNR